MSGITRYLATADDSLSYGYPGKPGYEYARPFDYFDFEFTAVNKSDNLFEGIMVRGLLVGKPYGTEDTYRGVRGLYSTNVAGLGLRDYHYGVTGQRCSTSSTLCSAILGLAPWSGATQTTADHRSLLESDRPAKDDFMTEPLRCSPDEPLVQ